MNINHMSIYKVLVEITETYYIQNDDHGRVTEQRRVRGFLRVVAETHQTDLVRELILNRWKDNNPVIIDISAELVNYFLNVDHCSVGLIDRTIIGTL